MLKRLAACFAHSARSARASSVVRDYQVRVYLETDRGCIREINQDLIRFVKPVEPQVLNGKGILAMVCDGMGGERSGDLASSMSASAIESEYYRARSENVLKCLKNAFVRANRRVFEYAGANPEHRGMGTTATALVIKQGLAYHAHVGDSRLYLVRDGGISQITSDHSVVAEKVRQGLITPDQARVDAERNVMTQALGSHRSIDVELGGPFAIRDRDIFLLCSDGLYDLVSDQELVRAFADQPEASVTRRLVDLARMRGGYDNISLATLVVAEGPAHCETAPLTRI